MMLVPTGRTRDDFYDVCKTLFGDALDPDELRRVSKSSPDPADLNSSGSGGRHKIKPVQIANDRKSYRAGQATRRFARSRTGKVAAAGAATAAGAKVIGGGGRGRQQTEYDYYAPVNYAKAVGEFSKFDDEKQLAFGWASIVEMNGSPVVDKQGDYITIDDLEDAAYEYVHKSRVGGDMHRRNGADPHHVSDMVESIVFTDDKIAKMGLPDDFPRGWWVGFKVHDPETWQEVRKGGRTGFSIHGKGSRSTVPLDDVMGYKVTKYDFDPEAERQRRAGQITGTAGLAGAGGIGYGGASIARDTRRFRQQQRYQGDQVRDFNARMRDSKTRQLNGTQPLKSMAREGKLIGPNRTYVVPRRAAASLALGAGSLGLAAAVDRDAKSPVGGRWT